MNTNVKDAKHSFDEFKLYYDSTEKVTDRRLDTNRWNYSICIAILVAIATITNWTLTNPVLLWAGVAADVLLSIMAILFCALWIGQIRDFKNLNNAKFNVLNEMAPNVEFDATHPGQIISFCPFDKEWKKLSELQALQEVGRSNIVVLKYRILYPEGICSALLCCPCHPSQHHSFTLAPIITGVADGEARRQCGAKQEPMRYVYFISPVGSDPEYPAKRHMLSSLEAELNLTFFFPLERHTSLSLDESLTDIRRAHLVIADLSLERPSCYFELGVAEAVGARVAIIAAAGTVFHQMGRPLLLQIYESIQEYQNAVRRAVASAVRCCDP
jgi:hypothetical protein